MGKNVRINTAFLNDAYLLTLGDNVVLGGKATVSCHIFEKDRLILKPITIGSNCVVGAHAYVHPGVVMEDNSVIGIYALVPKDTVITSKTIQGHLPAMPYRELARLMRLSKQKD
jgi:acetyltransferase-like isoleucine patch superfamily enzyme